MIRAYQTLGGEKILEMQMEYLQNFRIYFNKTLLIFTFSFTKDSYKKIIDEFANSRQLTFSYKDLSDIYQLPEATYNPNDDHPTKEGHKLIAQDLFSYITQNKIIPCN